MRRYKNKPYKIRPYKSYRKKSRKGKVFLISILCILMCIIMFTYIFPIKEFVFWKPLTISNEINGKAKGILPLVGYAANPDIDYGLYRQQVPIKGIYVSGNRAGSEGMKELIDLCKRTEINAMVIDVKSDDGYLTFSMDNPIIKQAGIIPSTVPIKDIANLIEKLYENNIYPIARIIAFKDNIIKETHPEYMIRNKDGTFYESNEPGGKKATWLNPYNKDVWEYIRAISKEAAAVGFKEIQFDYIRFHEGTSEEKVDFGPESIGKGKAQIISEFTKYIVEQLHGEGVYVSADVFGAIITSKFDAETVGQDYVEMSKYLDYICPMVYPSHYANGSFGVENPDLDPYQIILSSMEASSDQLKGIKDGQHRAIVRPWLQDFTASWMPVHQVYGSKELREQIEGVYDAGLEEWLLWNASNRYTEAGLLAK